MKNKTEYVVELIRRLGKGKMDLLIPFKALDEARKYAQKIRPELNIVFSIYEVVLTCKKISSGRFVFEANKNEKKLRLESGKVATARARTRSHSRRKHG